MPGTTPVYGFPYPEPTDLVADYPALGQDLAEDVETVIQGLSPAWTSYTPVVTPGTGTATTIVTSGAYLAFGKLVAYRFRIEIQNKGTAAGVADVSLPLTAKGDGCGVFNETAINGNMGYARVTANSASARIAYYANGNIWTAGNGQIIHGTVVFERT